VLIVLYFIILTWFLFWTCTWLQAFYKRVNTIFTKQLYLFISILLLLSFI